MTLARQIFTRHLEDQRAFCGHAIPLDPQELPWVEFGQRARIELSAAAVARALATEADGALLERAIAFACACGEPAFSAQTLRLSFALLADGSVLGERARDIGGPQAAFDALFALADDPRQAMAPELARQSVEFFLAQSPGDPAGARRRALDARRLWLGPSRVGFFFDDARGFADRVESLYGRDRQWAPGVEVLVEGLPCLSPARLEAALNRAP